MSDFIPMDFNNERFKYQHQIILTSDRINTRVNAIEESLFSRVHEVNKDFLCEEYRQAIYKGESTLHCTKLDLCRVVDSALFKNNVL